MTVITSPTIFSASIDTITKKGGIFKINVGGNLEYISRQKPEIEATSLTGLIELAQLGTTIIDGGYIKTSLIDANVLLTDVLFVGDMLAGGYLIPSLINVSSLVISMGLGSLAYESVVEAAMLGTTLIDGGYIKTNLIDTNAILTGVLFVGDVGAIAALDAIEFGNLGATIISGGYIRTSLLSTDVLVVGDADLTSLNIAFDTSNVAGTAASTIRYNALNPAAVINAGVTTISGGKITTGSIAADKIIGNSITAGQIAAGAITAIELGAASVTAVKIAAGQVTAGKLAASSVVTSNIVTGNITTDTITTNATTETGYVASLSGIQISSTGAVLILSTTVNINSFGALTIQTKGARVTSSSSGPQIADFYVTTSDGSTFRAEVDDPIEEIDIYLEPTSTGNLTINVYAQRGINAGSFYTLVYGTLLVVSFKR